MHSRQRQGFSPRACSSASISAAERSPRIPPCLPTWLAGDEFGARDGREITHVRYAPEAQHPERLDGGIG